MPAATLLLAGTCLSTPALSQSAPVTVDLSVLNDGGHVSIAVPGYTSGSMELLMPGSVSPKSTYFGPSVYVSNPILPMPSTPVYAETDSEAMPQAASQAITTSELTTADVVPPPPPEPVAAVVPAEEEVVAAEASEMPAVPEAPEAVSEAPAPEIPTEPAVTSTAPDTVAVALEPTTPDAPPAAPEAPEVMEEAVESATAPTGSATETTTTEVAAASGLASGMSASGHALQIIFGDDDSKLPGGAETELGAIAEQVKGTDDFRIQLLAYAGGENLSASKARRLSLSRALSVRSFFIENGVRSTRIDVRALGDKTDEQPINRVDINIVER